MNKLKSLWNGLPDSFKRIVHTIWQSAGAAILTYVETPNSSHTMQGVLFVVQAAVLSAGKAGVLKYFLGN